MNKKTLNALGTLALVASLVMYFVGTNDSHLTELADFFWSPLILSAVCFMAASKQK